MTSQSPAGRSSGAGATSVVRRPWTLPAAARASANVSPTDQPPRRRGRPPARRPARCRRRSPPWPSATPGPTSCAAPPSSVARRAAARGHAGRRRRRTIREAHRGRRRPPAGRILQVARRRGSCASPCSDTGGPGAHGRPRRRRRARRPAPEGLETDDDARRAEAALAGPAAQERLGPGVTPLGRQAFDRGDRAAGHPAQRRDTGHPRLPVDQHRAAPALTLGAAAVLHRTRAEAVAQRLGQRARLVVDHHFAAIEGEGRHR